MALSSKFRVPLPEKGIIVRRSGKYQYVYKVTRTFRDAKGHPTNTRVAIGRLDPESGELVPNDAYWSLCDPNEGDGGEIIVLPSPNSVRSVGATFLVGSILRTLGVANALIAALGENAASQALTVGAYMACRGNVMEHAEDWCEGFTLHETPITSPGSSLFFASIGHDARMAFFRRWVALQTRTGYLAYDVTSFSTYATGIKDAEWGYNRDGEDLPQINLGCYLGQESGLPVFYVTYPGSIVDKSHLPYMMAYNDELGISEAGFVLDKGFCTTANVQYMHSAKLHFVMGVEMGHKATMAAIDDVRAAIMSMRHRLPAGIHAHSSHGRFYGVTSTMHIYYDPKLADRQRSNLTRSVEADAQKLAQLAQLTKKEAKRFGKRFDIQVAKNGAFEYALNYDKVDAAAKNFGFFCLLTDMALGSADVLAVYRRKDVIEKGFDDIKNHIDMKRLRTHTDATTDGKVFCAFVALIAVCEITNRLRSFMRERSMSKDDLISEMEKIKVVITESGKRLMNPITKTQRTILEACGLTEDDLKAYVGRR
jgi:transposase